jgi:hypothetical protein
MLLTGNYEAVIVFLSYILPYQPTPIPADTYTGHRHIPTVYVHIIADTYNSLNTSLYQPIPLCPADMGISGYMYLHQLITASAYTCPLA